MALISISCSAMRWSISQNGRPVAVDVWFREVPAAGDPLLARADVFCGLRCVCDVLGYLNFTVPGWSIRTMAEECLIIGPSGSGKSTLALQLAMAGWPYLSDDELLLSLVDGGVEARGFRSFFAMSTARSRFKNCFEPDAVFEAPRRSQALPGVLLFTSLSGEQKPGSTN